MENKLVIGILNIFEDKLREFGIQLPDDDREDSNDPIVGYQYAELHDRIRDFLEEEGVIKAEVLSDRSQDECVKAKFVSVWDGGFCVETDCKVNMKTGEIYDIEVSEGTADYVNELDEEFIRFPDGTEHTVSRGQEDGGFWYGDDDIIETMSEPQNSLIQAAAKIESDPPVNIDTAGLEIAGHVGTWHTIDNAMVDGHMFWLMEHDTYGDRAACIILDDQGNPVLSNIYDGFDAHTLDLLHQEVMPVGHLPDSSITVDEMKQYGYYWGGMLPMREAVAAEVMKSCTIYRLYADDTEGLIMDASELSEHAAQGGIFGVEKVDWAATKEGRPLLADKISIVSSPSPSSNANPPVTTQEREI